MTNKNKYIKLITQLNRKTKEGKLKWKRIDPPDGLTKGSNDEYIDFYRTEIGDILIGIGEYRFKDYIKEFDKFYWSERVVLVLLRDNNELEYKIPVTEGLWDLIDTIRQSYANVEYKVDRLFNQLELGE